MALVGNDDSLHTAEIGLLLTIAHLKPHVAARAIERA